jgi:hypothetical protein
MNNHFWHATLVAFAVMLSISTIGHARAHDHQHLELNSWYESLYSGKGPCCDGSDAKRVDDGKLRTVTIARALMASGLMFRKTLSWMDRTALVARWSGPTI